MSCEFIFALVVAANPSGFAFAYLVNAYAKPQTRSAVEAQSSVSLSSKPSISLSRVSGR